MLFVLFGNFPLQHLKAQQNSALTAVGYKEGEPELKF